MSHNAKKYKIVPIIDNLKKFLDDWNVENRCIRELSPFASVIPTECINDYVWCLTHTYLGYIGNSSRFARTDFYADDAAIYIPTMFQAFNDQMAVAFFKTIRESELLKSRIRHPSKIKRLRSLALVLEEKISESFEEMELLTILIDETREEEFFGIIKG